MSWGQVSQTCDAIGFKVYKEVFTFLPQGLEMHTKPWVRARASKEYWEKMRPAGDKRNHHNHFPGGRGG